MRQIPLSSGAESSMNKLDAMREMMKTDEMMLAGIGIAGGVCAVAILVLIIVL